MREIEFRAWLKKHLKLVNVQRIDFEAQEIVYDEIDFEYEDVIREKTALFKDISLLEYTGIKDKNGVKIFEGDIVRTYRLNVDKYLEDRTREYDEFIGVITWNEEYLEYYIQKNSNEYEDVLKPFERHYEVIGNIYENKELLGWFDE